jgi:endonuclease III-like uncharacterized protein
LYIISAIIIHITNWANIHTQVEELATTNDTNIWMIIFFDANVHFPPQEITNCIWVELYNIIIVFTSIEYVITPHIGMSTIPNSYNVDA